MCEYKYRNGEKCHRETLASSEKSYCLLHEDWNNKDEEETREQFYEEIEEGETNFEGCLLPGVNLSNRKIRENLIFMDATARNDINLTDAIIEGDAIFTRATIEGNALFTGANIEGDVAFYGATIRKDTLFIRAVIKGNAAFHGLTTDGTFSFKEAKVGENLMLVKATVSGNVWLTKAIVNMNVSFKTSTIEGNSLLNGAIIKGDASFVRAVLKGVFSFKGTVIEGTASFKNSTLRDKALFNRVIIEGNAWFTESKLKENTRLHEAVIEGNVSFKNAIVEGNISFTGAKINGNVSFLRATLKDEAWFNFESVYSLAFEGTYFRMMKVQENACREAKIVNERRGDGVLADYHFHREMEARARQLGPEFNRKDWPFGWRKKLSRWREIPSRIKWTDWKGWLQLPQRFFWFLADLTTAFGTSWFRVLSWWGITIVGFGLGFYFGNGLLNISAEHTSLGESFYFSVITFTNLGYGDLQPKPGGFRAAASIESLLGAFFMAAFILVFGRKFMR